MRRPTRTIGLGLGRRAFLDLSIGAGIGGGLGLSLSGLLRARVAGAEVAVARPIRACILLFWYGGPSHLDTFDMKPSAPADTITPSCATANSS